MVDHATDIEIDGVGFRHLITSRHDSVTARTAIHTTDLPKRLGGVRFVEQGSAEEVGHLAMGMSQKAAAADVPIDGLKCLIECPDGVPPSATERAALIAAHLRLARQIDADIIFGPDMLAPECVLSLVADEPDLSGHVTGLDRQHGGIDIDGNALTAIGVFEAIVQSRGEIEEQTVAIQGFGAVGAELAKLLAAAGARVVAVSNKYGLTRRDSGLDVATCYDAWRRSGDSWLQPGANDRPQSADGAQSVLTIPCDILIPPARTAVIAAESELASVAPENPDVIAVERLLEAGAPTTIAEAANYPITERAERLLQDQGTKILPDVLINCGGMIGCWYEYDNRQALLGDRFEYERALDACYARIQEVIAKNTRSLVEKVHVGQYARDVAEAAARR